MPNALPSLDTLFSEAVEIADAGDRAAYLARACPDDALRRRVEALVAAHFRAGDFLAGPPTTTDVPAPADEPEAVIGHYKLRECLGEGGMGAVYVAEQTEPVRRRVALKVIKPGMDTKEVVARFEAERQALALMDHPHIAKVLDGGATAAGRPYFVMELVRGLPITEYCDQAKLPAERRLRLFAQVCRAVQHAHQKGVIHRDLKPSNVLVTLHDGEPVPKVIDFGVAKAVNQPLTDKSVYTRFNQLVGTPLYMAPEQAELSGLDIDTRSDVYALGVLLYELLTGTTPFDAETLRMAGFDEMRRMIREDEPPRPSARVSTLDAQARSTAAGRRGLDERHLGGLLRGDLDWLAMKALEKDRNRRYESAGAFAADVERYLANEPVQARPPSAVYRLRKLARRNKAAVTSTALVTLAILLGAGASVWKYLDEQAARRDADDHRRAAERSAADALTAQQEAERQRNAVARNLYTADMRLGLGDWQAGNIDRLTRKLDDHKPRAGDDDRRGWEWYYLRSLCRQDDATLAGKSHSVDSLAWSPDGRLLASASGGTTTVWDADTWKAGESFAFASKGLSWSPDGRRLAGGRLANDCRVLIRDMQTRDVMALSGHTSSVWSTAWSLDGRRLTSAGMDGTVRVWDTATGMCLQVWEEPGKRIHALDLSPDGTRLAQSLHTWQFKIRDATTGRVLHEEKLPEKSSYVAWNPRGEFLAVGTWAGVCIVVRTSDWARVATWPAHSGNINALRWSPDGKYLATAGDDNLIRVFDALGSEQSTLRGHLNCVLQVAWDPRGRRLASGGMDHRIKVWTVPTAGEPRRLTGDSRDFIATAWGAKPDELLVLDPSGGTITSRNFGGGTRLLRSFDPRGADFGAVSATGRKAVAAARGERWRFDLYDLDSGAPVQFDSHLNPNGIAFSPDDSYLAVGGWGGMTVRDVRQNQVWFDFQCTAIHGFAWSPDGRLLAAGGRGQAGVYVFDVAQRKLVLTTPLGPGGYGNFAVVWSADGKRLAAGDANGLVEVFEMPTGRKLAGARLHSAHVMGLAWSADGLRVASGSRDRTVRLWDSATCDELLRFDTPGMEVNQVLWSADGRKVVGAGHNGEVRVWDATRGYQGVAATDG